MDIKELLSKKVLKEFVHLCETDGVMHELYEAVENVLEANEFLSNQKNSLYDDIPAEFIKRHLPHMLEIFGNTITPEDSAIIYWFVHGD